MKRLFDITAATTALVALFHKLEKSSSSELSVTDDLLKELTPQSHADSLKSIITQES